MTGYNARADWYMYGMVLFECLVGRTLLEGEDVSRALKGFGRGVRDLVSRLLESDPDRRLGRKAGAEEVLGHPWFRTGPQ
jgi:hypothetical protein